MRQPLRHGPVFVGGLLAFALTVACGHENIPRQKGSGSGNTGNIPSTAGTSSSGGSGAVGGTSNGGGGGGATVNLDDVVIAPGEPLPTPGEKMMCSGGAIVRDKTRPGDDFPASPEVAQLMSSMTLKQKIQQMQSVDTPATRDPGVYRDIERSPDTDMVPGLGKRVLGYRYRDAGHGVNLAGGQDNRPSQGNDFSTVFPTQSARAASWDVDLEYRLGEAMGEETMTSKNNMLLAPCMNIVRHPYWGRTQETYSEDMYHTGRMASALTAGIQQHVVACAKHWAANNVENNRVAQNAVMDEQTLREVYAPHFDMVVRDGGIGCIMASYNLLNGVKNTQNKHLLTDLLKAPVEQNGMGYKGLVITDWWAMPGDQGPVDTSAAQRDAVQAVLAGLDIEVPWNLHFDQLETLVTSGLATPSGTLTQADIDNSARRVLEQKARFGSLYMTGENPADPNQKWGLGESVTRLEGDSITDNEQHLALAEEAAVKSAVLLKNGPPGMPVLPIKDAKNIAVLGIEMPMAITQATECPKSGCTMHFATDVNLGDRGSSRVNADPAKSIGPFQGISDYATPKGITVTTGTTAEAGMGADLIVVSVGLTAGDEGEEYSVVTHGDRTTLSLPGNQEQFINDVLNLNKPTVIIIQAGNIVNLPWLNHANQQQATIWAGYAGQRQGAAFAKLLFGEANFSGKMFMAWPKQEDLPPFTTEAFSTNMGYFFGYRYYDDLKRQGKPVELVFPFGYGLSYTTFAYKQLDIPCATVTKDSVIEVKVVVSNTGPVKGEEVVMMFVAGPPKPANITGARPVKELKGFRKVALEPMGTPGDTKQITMQLKIQDLRHWEGDVDGSWVIDPGEYTIMVGPNADDAALTLQQKFTIAG